MKKEAPAIVVIMGFILATCIRVYGDATINWYSMGGFEPATVVVAPGDTVTWVNKDTYGFSTKVTISGGFSFNLPHGQSHGVVFAAAGTYNFASSVSGTGLVIVNIPPSVAITNPMDGDVLGAPATFVIAATASDTPDDYVADVQFYLGTDDTTNALEDVTSPPYTTSVTNLAAGTYVLMAVATDSHGAQATNSITITVGAAGINLIAPRIVARQFLFDVSGLTNGKTNVLQTSTNFLTWAAVNTNIATGATMTMTNPAAPGSCFYRVFQLP